jgi:hypothetical protein
MTRDEINIYLMALNEELKARNVTGEVYLIGGAVMCVTLGARASTKDVDAIFEPKAIIAESIAKVAAKYNVSQNWLNDAAKGYLSEDAKFDIYLELTNLKIFTATPEYILAMKCMSMRLAESEDISDVEFLIKHLNIANLDEAISIVEKYYPANRIPPKTVFALEELFEKISPEKNNNA